MADGLLGAVIGAVITSIIAFYIYHRQKINLRQNLLAIITAEAVFAFQRIVVILKQTYPVPPAKSSLTKTALFSFIDISTLNQISYSINDPKLLGEVFYLKERYFHANRHLDRSSELISRAESMINCTLEELYKKDENKLSEQEKEAKRKADESIQRQATALAFLMERSAVFGIKEKNETFPRIIRATNYIIKTAKKYIKKTALDELEEIPEIEDIPKLIDKKKEFIDFYQEQFIGAIKKYCEHRSLLKSHVENMQ